MIAYTLVYCVLVFAMGGIALCGLRRDLWRGVVLATAFIALSGVLYAFGAASQGLSRPYLFAPFFPPEDSRIVGVVPIEGRAIYVWLFDGSEPVAWVLPWSDETARDLHEAMQESAESGTGAIIVDGAEFAEGAFVPHPEPVTGSMGKD